MINIWLGEKVNNYIEDATDNAATNAKWTSNTEQEFTVPAGKRWFLMGMIVKRDAAKTLAVTIKDRSDDPLLQLTYLAAGTEAWIFPTTLSNLNHMIPSFPIVMDEGEYVHIICGDAQGAGAYASCVVIEVDI